MRIDAETGKCKLAHIRSADADHAGLFQRGHHIGVPRRRLIIRKHGRSGRGHRSLQIKKILPGHGNALEKPAGTAFANACRCGLRFGGGPLRRQPYENGLIGLLTDRIDCLFHQGARIKVATLDESGKLRDVLAPVSHDEIP